jgi:hypothetical protein
MDVVVWLRSLGLGKYEAAFRENDIDETVLPSLTHENLKELGVTSLGLDLNRRLRCHRPDGHRQGAAMPGRALDRQRTEPSCHPSYGNSPRWASMQP